MVSIKQPPTPGVTTPTLDSDIEVAQADEVRKTAVVEQAATLEKNARHSSAAPANETLPGHGEQGADQGIGAVGALFAHAQFGDGPGTTPSTGVDLQVPTLNPEHLAADLPGMLNAERASYPPESLQAAALAKLAEVFGTDLHLLGPQYYLAPAPK